MWIYFLFFCFFFWRIICVFLLKKPCFSNVLWNARASNYDVAIRMRSRTSTIDIIALFVFIRARFENKGPWLSNLQKQNAKIYFSICLFVFSAVLLWVCGFLVLFFRFHFSSFCFSFCLTVVFALNDTFSIEAG